MSDKIELTLQVANEVQAQELRQAWQEIVAGKLERAQANIPTGMEEVTTALLPPI